MKLVCKKCGRAKEINNGKDIIKYVICLKCKIAEWKETNDFAKGIVNMTLGIKGDDYGKR